MNPETYAVLITANHEQPKVPGMIGTKQIALVGRSMLDGNFEPKAYYRIITPSGVSSGWTDTPPNSEWWDQQELKAIVAHKLLVNDQLEIDNNTIPVNLLTALGDLKGFALSGSKFTDVVNELHTEIATKGTALFSRFTPGNSKPATPARTYVEKADRKVFEITSDYTTADLAETSLSAWATLRKPQMTDPDVADYVERMIWGQPEHSYLDFARENQYPVIINGEAGTGKTTASAYYSASRGVPLAVIECNTMMTEASVQGKYVPSGKGNELVWRYSAFATAITQPSVILLNETTRMPARTNALFLRVLHERELIVDTHHNEVIKLHPDCLIIADANYGYRGTMDSDQAFLDRFAVKVEFAYDTEVEKHFIPSPSLLELAKEMRRLADTDGSFSIPISTRLLKNFVKIAQGLSMEFAIGNFAHNFPADERSSVEMLFQTYADNISAELGIESVEL
jgi:MoxR-like ATPase